MAINFNSEFYPPTAAFIASIVSTAFPAGMNLGVTIIANEIPTLRTIKRIKKNFFSMTYRTSGTIII